METLFAKRVRGRMRELDMTQDKELAAALTEQTGLSFSTVEPKLSKLLRGRPEGRQLLTAKRLPAWAKALQLDVPTIERWDMESEARYELVLDPRLDDEIVSYLREHDDGERFAIADSPAEELADSSCDAWLRDAARKLPNPLVILSRHASKTFFAGAELATDVPERVPRGWVLTSHANIIPPPPEPAPVRFDEDGKPLYPSREHAREQIKRNPALLTKTQKRELKKLEDELRDGLSPSFPLPEVLSRLIATRVPGIINAFGRLGDLDQSAPVRLKQHAGHSFNLAEHYEASKAGAEDKLPTIVWWHQDRCFALGPHAADLTNLFAPHHPNAGCIPFEIPEWIDQERRRRNLWLGPNVDWWKRASDEVARSFGVSLDSFLVRWKAEAIEQPANDRTRLLRGDELEAARSLISDLAHREFSGNSLAPLQLAALSESRLAGRPCVAPEVLHVQGDLGAGRVLEVRVFCFDGDEPKPFSLEEGEDRSLLQSQTPNWLEFDGGDVRISWLERYDRMLEGTARPARERSRRQRLNDDED